jgi:hypothetical protein
VSPRRRFFFVHVQKAAGTALFRRLMRHFERQAIYPDPSDGDAFDVAPQISVAQLLSRWEQRRDEIEIVTGHFPLATVELLDADFVTLTVLREPVDRVISQLGRFRERTPSVGELSLEAIYEARATNIAARNHMVKMFAMTADEVAASTPELWPLLMPVDLTSAHLARAKEQLAGVDAVGLQSRFEEFCDELQARFGWKLGDPVHMNRTTHPAEVSDDFRARIAADNALDIEFFEFASDLYERRLAERGGT